MDRFNPSEVLPLLPFIDEDSSSLYEYMTTVWDKRRVSDRYKYGNYHSNAPAIALSTWSRARKIIMCGTPGYEGRTSFCNNVRYCSTCAGRKARLSYVRYQQSFKKARHWYALTYSFKSNVFLATATQEEYLGRWKVADSFIRSLRVNGYLNGAFAVKELAINSIAGKAVFPHTHVVFNSDREDLVNDEGVLHPSIQEEAIKENVSLRLTRITDESTFLYEVKYPIKPLNIQSLYEAETNCTPTEQLNLNLDLILARTSLYEDHTQKVVYYGNMDPRCKALYIGTDMKAGKRKPSTKELNSTGNTATLKSIRIVSVTDTVMPMPSPTAAVLPPLRKKRSLLAPLLTGAAGVAGLGALDHYFNQGRLLRSLTGGYNPLHSTYSQYKTLQEASQPFNAAYNDAAGAGSSIPVNMPALLPKARLRPYVLKAPANNSELTADIAANKVGPYNPAATAGAEAASLNRSATDGVNLPFAGNAADSSYGGRLDTAADWAWKGGLPLDAATLGYSGALGTAKMLAPNAVKSLTTGPVGNIANKVTGASRLMAPVGGGLLGASAGAHMGANDLFLSDIQDAHPDWSPEKVLQYSQWKGGLLGGASGVAAPVIGPLAYGAASAVADNAADQVRTMSGNSSQMQDLSDMMVRHYRGVMSGDPGHREAARKLLAAVHGNPELMKNINTGGKGAWLGWDWKHPFSGTGAGNMPAYPLRRLMDQINAQLAY